MKMRREKLLIAVQISILVTSLFHSVSTARILFYIGASSHSHRVALQPLATALFEKGHHITFMAPIRPEVENPQIMEFFPKAAQQLNDALIKSFSSDPVVARMKDKNYNLILVNFGTTASYVNQMSNEIAARGPDLKEFLQNSKFDLVITEHPYKEVAFGFAHKLGAKVIGFSPCPFWPQESDMTGIPTESSWYSSVTLSSPYNFIPDNFYHEFNALAWYFYYNWNYLPRVDALLKEVFGEDTPPILDLIQNVSLYFINTHFSSEYAKSLPPFVIPVGGMHIKDSEKRKPLPKNMDDFINAPGSEGFVYISFGSLTKLAAFPHNIINIVLNSVGRFENIRFLLTWDDEIPADMPKNVLPMKWFPQEDLLAHPMCRGFVSQGGIVSVQQATYHGIPLLIIPVFGDQPYNARVDVRHGHGIHLEFADLTLNIFSHAIHQLLYNTELSAGARKVARRFKDRPISPLETAVWWTEYVLRHNDTSHLKPLGINQTWWQRRQLDFWGLICLFIFLLVLTSALAIRRFILWFQKRPKSLKLKNKMQ